MKKNIFLSTLIILLLSQTIIPCAYTTNNLCTKAHTVPEIVSLFALTADEISHNTNHYINQTKKLIDSIIIIPDNQRTFTNTIEPIDEIIALSDIAIARAVYHSLERLSSCQDIRDAAHDACIAIDNFIIDHVTNNKAIYHAFIAYAENNKNYDQLSNQQRYFIDNRINIFKREGLSLPTETLELVTALRKEIVSLASDFERNITDDNRSISVELQELIGLEYEFIDTLPRTPDDLYILGIDYPTYRKIMESCSITTTRKKLHSAFNNRAYPANDIVLKQIIQKRDELAKLLGYSDFAHYDINDQMVQTPEKVQTFITDIVQQSWAKVEAEIATLTSELPQSVQLTQTGQIQPWDLSFITSNYIRNNFNFNEQEYFPLKNTIAELLDIYRQFFSIDFQEVSSSGLWHEDVIIIQVTNKQKDQLLGTLLLDLYPRTNKHSHPCQITIVPGCYRADSTHIPNVSIVIANFTKPTATKPSLLTSSEVQTFFHEFGHALHDVLGATEIASLSGTHTKTDFVELPSQMLEEWLTDKDILKKISHHYQTGEPLPDNIIDVMISLKNLIRGFFINQQAYFAQLSLSYFGQGADKNPHTIMQDIHTKIMPHIAWAQDNHLYASFGHLTGYGAKYYGYVWSKVFALDLFATIKQHGLLNPEIGQRYIKEVIGKGGAQDPNELLYNFLGREPNAQAFLKDMGL